jgi:hypothetical protein
VVLEVDMWRRPAGESVVVVMEHKTKSAVLSCWTKMQKHQWTSETMRDEADDGPSIAIDDGTLSSFLSTPYMSSPTF